MELTSLGYRTDLMTLAMQGAEILHRGDHLVVHTATQPTFHWGNFLLFADPPAAADADRWQHLFSAEFPDATHVAFGIDSTDGTAGDLSGFAAAGITADRSVVLTAHDVQPPPRPNTEARLRMLASDDDWAQAVELRMAIDDAVEDPGHRLFVERKNDAMRAMQEAGKGSWFGAFVDGRLVAPASESTPMAAALAGTSRSRRSRPTATADWREPWSITPAGTPSPTSASRPW